MRPEIAETEFLYAHEYAGKSVRWYQQMLGVFTTPRDIERWTGIVVASASSCSASMILRAIAWSSHSFV